jgi:hypothetical protein
MKYVLIGLVAVLVLLIGFLAVRQNQPPAVKPELISVSFAGGSPTITTIGIRSGLNEPRPQHDPNAWKGSMLSSDRRWEINNSHGSIVLTYDVIAAGEFKLRVSCSRPVLLHLDAGSGKLTNGSWYLFNSGVETLILKMDERGELDVVQRSSF